MLPHHWPKAESTDPIGVLLPLGEQVENGSGGAKGRQHRGVDEKVVIIVSESQLKFIFKIYIKVLDFGTLVEKTGDILGMLRF